MAKARILRFLTTLLCAALLFPAGGCVYTGGSQNNVEERETKTLTMWKFRSNKEDYVLYRWVKQWNEENPYLQVDLEVIPYNDYLTTHLPAAFATASGPDIYMISAGGFLKYAAAGYMYPLDDYISEELRSDFNPESLNAVTYQGQILGIPIEREPLALFYNQDMFCHAHLDPPATWEDLVNCAKALQTDAVSGICLPTQINDYQNFIFEAFLIQVISRQDSQTLLTEFQQGGAQVLALWRELQKYNYVPESSQQSSSDIYPLATGKAAMQVCGLWAVGTLEKYYENLDYGVIPIPTAENGVSATLYGGWCQAVNPYSELRDQAAQFTLWMWGQDASRPLEWCVEASTKVPARNSIIYENQYVFYSNHYSLFVKEILPTAIAEPRYPVQIANIISGALQDAMYTDKDIDTQIAPIAQRKIDSYVRSHPEYFQ